MMNCPGCSGELAEKSYAGNIRVDECVSCHGVWFDKGEIDIYRATVEIQARHGDPLAFSELDHAPPKACPKCQSTTLVEGEVREIRLERCQVCHGVFVSYDQLLDIKDQRKPELFPIGPTILDILQLLTLR